MTTQRLSAGWVPSVLRMLDHQYDRFGDPTNAESHFGGQLIKEVPEPPSYYWKTNCYAGASFFRPSEVPLRYEIGLDKIMWSTDYPHTNSNWPSSQRIAAYEFREVPDDERRMIVRDNAASLYRLAA